MNIDAGLKKLDEISGNVDGKCWSPTAYALRQILEAMKDGTEQRLQHLEKLEDYVKELAERVEKLEPFTTKYPEIKTTQLPHPPTDNNIHDTLNCPICQKWLHGNEVKPSVPEKPKCVLCGVKEDIRGGVCFKCASDAETQCSDTISIPRDVAVDFTVLIDELGGTWSKSGAMRRLYDAIKQALKGA